MTVVFKKEFKSLFLNIRSILCITVYMVVSGVLLVINSLKSGYSGIEAVLAAMSLISAITVPAVVSDIMLKDRVRGYDRYLMSMPLTRTQIVLGKYLAALVLFMIPGAVLAVYPIVLASFGGSLTGAYAVLLMFFLLQAFFVAFCMAVSEFCNKAWKAFVISYSFIVLTFAIGVLAAVFPEGLKNFFKFFSPFRRFDPVSFGTFDLTSVIFYISLTVLFLCLCIVKPKKDFRKERGEKEEKRRNFARSKRTLTALVLVACVLANLALYMFPMSIRYVDITESRFYSLSKETKEYLKGVSEDITVYLLNPNGAEEKLDSYIRMFCERSGKIKLKRINTEKDTEFLKKYGLEGRSLSFYSMIVESEKRWRLVTSEDCFKYYHGEVGYMSTEEYQNAVSYYSQLFSYYKQAGASENDLSKISQLVYSLAYESSLCLDAERAMTDAVEYVTAESIPTVYYVSGHGEKNTEANPLDITALDELPDNASMLIINSPDSDYSEAEAAMLLSYAEEGGRLAVLANRACGEMQNLNRLLACYGLSLNADTLREGEIETHIYGSSTETGGIKLLDPSAISFAERDELRSYPFLSVTDENGYEQYPAMAVYSGTSPKLFLFTGADSFNRNRDGMSELEKQEYADRMSFLSTCLSSMKESFEPSVTHKDPKAYSPRKLSMSEGQSTVTGVIFTGILPVAYISTALLLVYSRKRRSKSENSQAR